MTASDLVILGTYALTGIWSYFVISRLTKWINWRRGRPRVRWEGPWWHRWHPRYSRSYRNAMAVARQHANDSEHIARVNDLRRRIASGEEFEPMSVEEIRKRLRIDG